MPNTILDAEEDVLLGGAAVAVIFGFIIMALCEHSAMANWASASITTISFIASRVYRRKQQSKR